MAESATVGHLQTGSQPFIIGQIWTNGSLVASFCSVERLLITI